MPEKRNTCKLQSQFKESFSMEIYKSNQSAPRRVGKHSDKVRLFSMAMAIAFVSCYPIHPFCSQEIAADHERCLGTTLQMKKLWILIGSLRPMDASPISKQAA